MNIEDIENFTKWAQAYIDKDFNAESVTTKQRKECEVRLEVLRYISLSGLGREKSACDCRCSNSDNICDFCCAVNNFKNTFNFDNKLNIFRLWAIGLPMSAIASLSDLAEFEVEDILQETSSNSCKKCSKIRQIEYTPVDF